ncbi:nuclease-related domain-containing protein [Peribacillus sp. SCS-37]|uniref:nuclease-related domain-containing protein n=1 Tax=Paraperibacillus esterisolvens TaxID=3115296 RepID=UPI0039065F5D
MIKKERDESIMIQKLKALNMRLAPGHPARPQVEEQLGKSLAGFRGEKSIDYFLTFLPPEQFFILHDLRLPHTDSYYFQIDTLLLSPRLIVIIEMKNIIGELYFDDDGRQLIRTLDGKTTAFDDPRLQAGRHRRQLEALLRANHFPDIPIYPLVLISNPAAIIKGSNRRSIEDVLHLNAFPDKFDTLCRRFTEEKVNSKELNKLSRMLIKQHSLLDPNVLSKFGLASEDILPGVQCTRCRTLTMQRVRGTWCCRTCGAASKDAHLAALKDYALLLGPSISNQECRRFLGLSSMSIATKILGAMDLKSTGTFRDRRYVLSERGK